MEGSVVALLESYMAVKCAVLWRFLCQSNCAPPPRWGFHIPWKHSPAHFVDLNASFYSCSFISYCFEMKKFKNNMNEKKKNFLFCMLYLI